MNFIKRIGWGALGIVAIVLGTAWLNALATLDPFAHLRRTPDGLGPHMAVQLDDVKFQSWERGKLRATAAIERLNVRDDRQLFELINVSQGTYVSDEGKFAFSGPHGTWNAVMRTFEADRGVHIKNDKMDLKTDGFVYDERTSRLKVPSPIKGKLFEGDVVAEHLVYAMDDGSYTTGPATWEGKTVGPLQEIQGGEPTSWKFKTLGVTTHKGDIQILLKAEATDGEVIVKADKIERNVKTDVIVATGKVFYYSAKSNMVCERAVVYRKEKRAVLTGNVDMLIKPEKEQKLAVEEIPPFRPMVPDEVAKGRPSPPAVQKSEAEKAADEAVRSAGTAKQYPVSLTAAKIEYWYGKGQRRALVTGSPQAMQTMDRGRWRYVWAYRAEYDAEGERLKLFAADGKDDLRVKTSLGDDVTAAWFDISTKENEDDWTAMGLQGTLMPDDDEIPKSDGGPPPPLKGKIGTSGSGNRR